MQDLYPEIEPYNSGFLKVSDLHKVYFEEAGNPNGTPVLFLHGGPGGGLTPEYRRFFNPTAYRVILFDQRGCGQSRPHAELRENTTWDLVADIEKLRSHLQINSWLVFGGSWGSTLALIYAITHTQAIQGLILRGIFMARPEEIHWFYQEGASFLFPDEWEKYLAPIPEDERGDLVKAYYKRLTSDDRATRVAAARTWGLWEACTSCLLKNPSKLAPFEDDDYALAFAGIECHYFVNHIFVDSPSYILDHAHKLRHIPTKMVQGRYDVVCPVTSAWQLKKALPHAELFVIDDAGHSIMEPGIRAKLVQIMDEWPNP